MRRGHGCGLKILHLNDMALESEEGNVQQIQILRKYTKDTKGNEQINKYKHIQLSQDFDFNNLV